MSEDLLKKLRELSNLGKTVGFADKKSGGHYKVGEIIDEVSVVSSSDVEYKYFIQKIRTPQDRIEYRFCYYTTDAKQKRLVFGQYAIDMSERDFFELVRKAVQKFRI